MAEAPRPGAVEWAHSPRGFSVLQIVAGVLFGAVFLIDIRAESQGLAPLIVAAGVTVLVVTGTLGAAFPDRFGGDPKETWQVVLVLLAIAVLLVSLALQ